MWAYFIVERVSEDENIFYLYRDISGNRRCEFDISFCTVMHNSLLE